jgi:hypothetical protein
LPEQGIVCPSSFCPVCFPNPLTGRRHFRAVTAMFRAR